ncbi:MAG: flagellar export protein FliJ [Rhodocyclaceae bacterium]
MPHSFPFQSVLDLSRLRLDEAARALERLLANEQASSRTLGLLERYRDEYQARLTEAARNGISPGQWRNFQAFLGQLEGAIAQQRATLDSSKRHTADGQKAWLERRGKTRAFDTLSERHRSEEERAEDRREQKHSDECAMNLYRSNRP